VQASTFQRTKYLNHQGQAAPVQAGNASASISLQPTQFCYNELAALLMKYTNMILCGILEQTTDFTAMLLQPLI